MKLLVVGHSYLHAYGQSKYVAIKQQDPTLELRIVIPDAMEHPFGQYQPELAEGLSKDEVISIKRMFRCSHMTYVLNPFRLSQLLLTYKPDYIHIEEDPHSFIGVETVFLAHLFCRKALISFFIWDNLARIPSFPLNILKTVLSKYSLNRSVGVIAGNEEARTLLITRKGYQRKTTILPQLGVNDKRYETQTEVSLALKLKNNSGIPVIGYAGRLVKEKGILDLCEALQGLMHLSWRLVLIGSGPLQEEIVRRWSSIFGDRLVLCGSVPHARVADHLKYFDILVLPSVSMPNWKEQFGHVLLEAMAAGVAIIGSSSGAIPEVLGDAGVIFSEKRIPDLRDALAALLSSPKERLRLAQNGQMRARTKFSHESIARAYLQTFHEFQSQ